MKLCFCFGHNMQRVINNMQGLHSDNLYVGPAEYGVCLMQRALHIIHYRNMQNLHNLKRLVLGVWLHFSHILPISRHYDKGILCLKIK